MSRNRQNQSESSVLKYFLRQLHTLQKRQSCKLFLCFWHVFATVARLFAETTIMLEDRACRSVVSYSLFACFALILRQLHVFDPEFEYR